MASLGLFQLAHELMSLRSDQARMLHDPLAAAVLLREEVFERQAVRPFKRAAQRIGYIPQQPRTGIWIATCVSTATFRNVFAGDDPS